MGPIRSQFSLCGSQGCPALPLLLFTNACWFCPESRTVRRDHYCWPWGNIPVSTASERDLVFTPTSHHTTHQSRYWSQCSPHPSVHKWLLIQAASIFWIMQYKNARIHLCIGVLVCSVIHTHCSNFLGFKIDDNKIIKK